MLGFMFVVLLIAIVFGVNMIHKAVHELKDRVTESEARLISEIERNR
jgi:hypothetical protein